MFNITNRFVYLTQLNFTIEYFERFKQNQSNHYQKQIYFCYGIVLNYVDIWTSWVPSIVTDVNNTYL